MNMNRLLDNNLTEKDCAIVAIYNALIVAGKYLSYKKVKMASIKQGWYTEDTGFLNDHIVPALEYFGIGAKIVPVDSTKDIFAEVTKNGKSYLMICNYRGLTSTFTPGHAMVTTKGKTGVKMFNSVFTGYGWKTFSKEIRCGHIVASAVEIQRTL